MSTEENKALVRRLIEEVWNQGNLAIFDELYAPDFIFHDPGLPQVRTREEDKQWIARILKAFSDFHITIDDLIAEGDQVVVRLTARGTGASSCDRQARHHHRKRHRPLRQPPVPGNLPPAPLPPPVPHISPL